MQKKPEPTPYFHKEPMCTADYEIYYNRDRTLTLIPPARHNYYELYFLISGEVEYYVESRKYSLTSGNLILILPGQEHSAHISTECSPAYERYVLWLQPSLMEDLSSGHSDLASVFGSCCLNPGIRPDTESCAQVRSLLDDIVLASRSNGFGSDLIAYSKITELLVLIAQLVLFRTDFSQEYILEQPGQCGRIGLVLAYINDHIHRSIPISELCERFYVSRSQLSAEFRIAIGIPLHQYIVKKKLYLARSDIRSGGRVSLVAESYGFETYSSFYRAFRAEFGQSPRSFENQEKKKQ